MNDSDASFESDLRISLRVVAVGLIAVGTAVVFMANTPRAIGDRVVVVAFAVALWGMAALVWRLDNWRPSIARWVAAAGLIALFPVLIVFVVAQSMIVRGGATVGSVKG
jgi:ABC-type maltose transport system permease subunit